MGPSVASPIRFAAHQPAFAQKAFRVPAWWTFPTLISFAAGLLTNLRFDFGGRASLGELVLLVIAVFAVLANLTNPRFWNRRAVQCLAVLGISLCGYVISDLINSTPPDRLLRGWARMAFVIIDFLAMWALTRNNIYNLFALCVGDAFSTALTYGDWTDDFLYNYKFHLAIPITVLIIIVLPFLVKRRVNLTTGIVLVGMGICHLRLDFRTLGGICTVIGFALIARSVTISRLRGLYLTLLVMALIASSVAIMYLYTTTNEAFSERREGSNSQRLSLALAGLDAIERSPVFGLGSWVWDASMWNVYAGKMGRASLPDMGETLGPHSQVIQAWAEAGILGLVFFVYLAKVVIGSIRAQFFRTAITSMTPLFLLFLMVALWDIGFSPFANLHRLNIALALVITIHVSGGKAVRSSAARFPRDSPTVVHG